MRPFTEAEDVAGFAAARGILTSEGGKASHAALVARGMGRPCVCGASEIDVDVDQGLVHVNGRELRGGQMIAIDGSTGAITLDDVPLIDPGDLGGVPHRARLGGRAAPAAGEGQRGHAGGRGAGPDASAPRGSASAAPSTCSSALTGTGW